METIPDEIKRRLRFILEEVQVASGLSYLQAEAELLEWMESWSHGAGCGRQEPCQERNEVKK